MHRSISMSLYNSFRNWLKGKKPDSQQEYIEKLIQECYGGKQHMMSEAQRTIDLTGLSASKESMCDFLYYAAIFVKGNKTFSQVKDALSKILTCIIHRQ